jgi:hypothetical protein
MMPFMHRHGAAAHAYAAVSTDAVPRARRAPHLRQPSCVGRALCACTVLACCALLAVAEAMAFRWVTRAETFARDAGSNASPSPSPAGPPPPDRADAQAVRNRFERLANASAVSAARVHQVFPHWIRGDALDAQSAVVELAHGIGVLTGDLARMRAPDSGRG